MLNLNLLKYVSSFSDGRIRLRHKYFTNPEIVAELKEKIAEVKGITSSEFKTNTGSVLITYDTNILKKEDLLALAKPWIEKIEKLEKSGGELIRTSNEPWRPCSKIFNAILLGSFAITVVSIPLRAMGLHLIAGSVLVVYGALHTIQHKSTFLD